MKWHGEEAKRRAHRGAVRGLKGWAGDVLDRSQDQVPVAPNDAPGAGALKKSGRVDVDEHKLEAAVSYTSPPPRDDGRKRPSAGLAVVVHEDLTAHHAGGKRAKYLEQPVNATRRSGPEDVRREIARELL